MSNIEQIQEDVLDFFATTSIITASVGGSGTFSLDTIGVGFPEALSCAGPETVIFTYRKTKTPFGKIPIAKIIDIDGFPVIRIPYHGWHLPKATYKHTLATFWLLHTLGVKQIVIDSSVGGLNAKPWDYVIPSDVYIHNLAKDKVAKLARKIGKDPWVRMFKPMCPRITGSLINQAQILKENGTEEPTHKIGDVIPSGTTITTPLSIFETESEIDFYKRTMPEAVVLNQSSGQEAAAARILGMCVGFLNPVANFAEGLQEGAWMPEKGGMLQFYKEVAIPTGVIVYRTLRDLVDQQRDCQCASLSRDADLSEITHPNI